MKSIIILTLASLISTIGISQQLIVEHNGNDPVEIKTNNDRNVSLYTTHGVPKGYLGLFSGINDLDFGTAIGNDLGKVNLTTEGMPRLSVEPAGNVKIFVMDPATASAQQVAREPDGTLSLMSSSATTYAVGDFAQGGVVFWVSPSGEHGKVVSIYDIVDVPWSNMSSTVIGPSAESDINGAGNTVAIMMQSGHQRSAAQHCADLAYGGYDDWYLPSKDELNAVYLNKSVINTTAMVNGGESFAVANYWSSSESDGNIALRQDFNDGSQFGNPKSINNRVRAIRAF